MTELRPHPLCETFPLMTGDNFQALVKDIARHGLREPIMLFEGLVLGGRNRYAACQQAGVEPQFSEYTGHDSLAYVISRNVHRRHLTRDQRLQVIEALKDNPERSDRATAKVASVDHKTVAAVRTALQATGEIPQLTKRTGQDGRKRKQPASKSENERLAREGMMAALGNRRPAALPQPPKPDDHALLKEALGLVPRADCSPPNFRQRSQPDPHLVVADLTGRCDLAVLQQIRDGLTEYIDAASAPPTQRASNPDSRPSRQPSRMSGG
jgi:ParB-like chromosome segregation protein Spo0J